MTGRPRRLFFALWPDEALRAATVAATARAVGEAGGRTVPPENLHVTLAFVGSVPEVRVADAVAAGRTVPFASGVQAFDRVTAWGRRGPLVLEATRLEAPLATLQSSLENALSTAGFALDRRAFRPHITLAREPARRPAPAAPDAAGGSLAWPCTGFVLVDSDTGPGGSKYSVLERFGAS